MVWPSKSVKHKKLILPTYLFADIAKDAIKRPIQWYHFAYLSFCLRSKYSKILTYISVLGCTFLFFHLSPFLCSIKIFLHNKPCHAWVLKVIHWTCISWSLPLFLSPSSQMIMTFISKNVYKNSLTFRWN